MSKNSLILVLQNKQENSTIDMAKIHIKSEKLTPFGEIYYASKAFYALSLDKVIIKNRSKSTLFMHNSLLAERWWRRESEFIPSSSYLLVVEEPHESKIQNSWIIRGHSWPFYSHELSWIDHEFILRHYMLQNSWIIRGHSWLYYLLHRHELSNHRTISIFEHYG